MQNPALRTLYAPNKVRTIQSFHIGEYGAALALASFAGNVAVTTLLEHSMADKLEFVDSTDDPVQEMAKQAMAGRLVGRAASGTGVGPLLARSFNRTTR
jgi:hypothetical protein